MDSIYDLVASLLLGVRRSGSENALAPCPFHMGKDGGYEKNPSFCISVRTGLWLCFTCKEKGNLRSLLHRLEVDAGTIEGQYKYILEEAESYQPPRRTPLSPNAAIVDPLPESFLGLFDTCPLQLLEEGFDEQVLQFFEVGYDSTHERITFPIRDVKGNLIGISGRNVTGGGRYKVYDEEYPVWGLPRRTTHNRDHLWNGHRVFDRLFHRNEGFLVVVEGFKACMWLVQHGVDNVVALMGSFLTDPQKWLIQRMGVPTYLMLDNDKPGLEATPIIANLLDSALETRIVEYDLDKRQPSDLSSTEIHESLATAQDSHLWKIRGGNTWRMEKILRSSTP